VSIRVDVAAERRYWYPDDGGQVWLEGLTAIRVFARGHDAQLGWVEFGDRPRSEKT